MHTVTRAMAKEGNVKISHGIQIDIYNNIAGLSSEWKDDSFGAAVAFIYKLARRQVQFKVQ